MMVGCSLVIFLLVGAVAWHAFGSAQIFLAGKAALRFLFESWCAHLATLACQCTVLLLELGQAF